MRVIKMYCDRCGKEFKKWDHKHKETIGISEFVHDDNSDPYLDTPKDLCESCYIELEKWWFSGIRAEAQKGQKGASNENNTSTR